MYQTIMASKASRALTVRARSMGEPTDVAASLFALAKAIQDQMTMEAEELKIETERHKVEGKLEKERRDEVK